jgi:hypothetical protein
MCTLMKAIFVLLDDQECVCVCVCVCVRVCVVTVRTRIRTTRIKLLCGDLPLTDRQTGTSQVHTYCSITNAQVYSASTLFITIS